MKSYTGGETTLLDRDITREVLLLIAVLHPLKAEAGRIVLPPDATPELAERAWIFEAELLWASGRPSGPWRGCSWIGESEDAA